MSQQAQMISDMLEPSVEAMGFELVRVRLTGSDDLVLQIMAERPDGTMTIDDCADLSRAVSAILDVEDPIRGEYNLEVSSPGIDRPLVRPKDYERFVGHDAKVELQAATDGQRRFRGVIDQVLDDAVHLDTDQGVVALPFDEIASAKLVLTDALIDAHLAAEAAREASAAND